MDRIYCTHCLKRVPSIALDACPAEDCGRSRPAEGWATYESIDSVIDGRFRVRGLVGSGGAGLTYQCLDLDTGETVALKVLHPGSRRQTVAQRLALEAEALELLDHPGVVPFVGVRMYGVERPWLATTYLPGGSLSKRLRECGPLSTADVARVGVQLADALGEVHRQGIVHRDVKPANILIEQPVGPIRVRLGDFGIARVLQGTEDLPRQDLTSAGMFVGTPEFASPEQVQAVGRISVAVDAYALGLVLHFAATGNSLLRCTTADEWIRRREQGLKPWERPRLMSPEMSPKERALASTLDFLIDGLLREDPSARMRVEEAGRLLSSALLSFGRSGDFEEPESVGPTRLMRASNVPSTGNQPSSLNTINSIDPHNSTDTIDEIKLWRARSGFRRRIGPSALRVVAVLVLGVATLLTGWSDPSSRPLFDAYAERAANLLGANGVSRWVRVERDSPSPFAEAVSAPLDASEVPRSNRPEQDSLTNVFSKKHPSRSVKEPRKTSPVKNAQTVIKVEPPMPQVTVGSDDVWGVEARRRRYIGDALAYERIGTFPRADLFDD